VGFFKLTVLMVFSFLTEVRDLSVLARMRDLVPYLSSKYLSTFKQEDIQVPVPNL
jgi:hypothetical protein